jgi:death-on-curing protein
VTARLFLADNGQMLAFDKADAIRTVETLAAGALSEAALATWFRERLAER